MLDRNLLWVREPGSWGSQGWSRRRPLEEPRVRGLGHLARPELPPCSPSASWGAEGGADLLPPGVAPWPYCSVSAQQGAWGILVSDSGVCGVLAGCPAVWASWAASSISQGGRARPSCVMKATLSGPAQAGEVPQPADVCLELGLGGGRVHGQAALSSLHPQGPWGAWTFLQTPHNPHP